MSTVTRPLYAEVDQYEEVLDLIEQHHEEVEAAGGELPAHIAALLDEIGERIETKAGQVGLVCRNLAAAEAGVDCEIKRLQQRKKVLQNQQKGLKLYLRAQLDRLGITKVDNAICPIRQQINSSPSVELLDPVKAQRFYRTPAPEFSATLALEAVRNSVAGQLAGKQPFEMVFADLGIKVTRERHIRIG
jgi:hypothetical protein